MFTESSTVPIRDTLIHHNNRLSLTAFDATHGPFANNGMTMTDAIIDARAICKLEMDLAHIAMNVIQRIMIWRQPVAADRVEPGLGWIAWLESVTISCQSMSNWWHHALIIAR